jgi:hypothetical protein
MSDLTVKQECVRATHEACVSETTNQNRENHHDQARMEDY